MYSNGCVVGSVKNASAKNQFRNVSFAQENSLKDIFLGKVRKTKDFMAANNLGTSVGSTFSCPCGYRAHVERTSLAFRTCGCLTCPECGGTNKEWEGKYRLALRPVRRNLLLGGVA